MTLSGIRMIASDIDGTMLRTDGTLSDTTRQSLHRAREAGLHIVPATGRPFVVAGDVIDALGIDEYWVFANGAVTRHLGREQTIRAQRIDRETAVAVVERLRAKLPNVGFAIEFDLDVAYESGFERLVPVLPRGDVVTDVVSMINRDAQKVLVFDPTLTLDELYTQAVDVLGDDGVVSYSGLGFVEVAASQVTKALALEGLAADLGFTKDEVAAFGDNHNDIPMLEWAGHSFAMANATDDAKEAAQHVIGHTDDDALATVVDQIIAAN